MRTRRTSTTRSSWWTPSTAPSGTTRPSTGSASPSTSTGSCGASRRPAASTAACTARGTATPRRAPPAAPPGSGTTPSRCAATAEGREGKGDARGRACLWRGSARAARRWPRRGTECLGSARRPLETLRRNSVAFVTSLCCSARGRRRARRPAITCGVSPHPARPTALEATTPTAHCAPPDLVPATPCCPARNRRERGERVRSRISHRVSEQKRVPASVVSFGYCTTLARRLRRQAALAEGALAGHGGLRLPRCQ